MKKEDLPWAEYFQYDHDTGRIWWKKNHGKSIKAGDETGTSATSHGYAQVMFHGITITAHRLAWFLFYGEWSTRRRQVDHINGIRTDNRISNLRIATQSQNSANSNGRGKQKYKGVTWNKPCSKWRVMLMYQKKHIHIGMYDSDVEAATAYDNAARQYWGDYARVNFPKEKSNE